MSKRANGEGSIYRDESKPRAPWVASWSYEGKRHKKSFATQAEAKRHLQSIMSAQLRGEYAAPSTMTVGDWLLAYMRDVAPLELKKATLKTERRIVDLHFMPYLRNVRLQDPRLRDRLQALILEKSQNMKPSTVRRIKSVIHKALEEAVQRRYISHNPSDGLTMPRAEKSHVRALTTAQARKLLPFIPDTTNGRALRFTLLTGLRVGEVCALRWKDVDDNALHVAHAMSAGELSEPKTSAGLRSLALTDELRELLRTQKIAQAEERLHAGSAWMNGDFIFASAVGTPADRNNIGRTLRAALAKAGLPSCGVHALRHTFGSLLVDSGMSLASVSAMLGHSDPAFTLRTYVHSDQTTEQQGMEALSKRLV